MITQARSHRFQSKPILTTRSSDHSLPYLVQNWIEIDEEYEDDIELRRKLLAEQRDIVLQSTPEVILAALVRRTRTLYHWTSPSASRFYTQAR